MPNLAVERCPNSDAQPANEPDSLRSPVIGNVRFLKAAQQKHYYFASADQPENKCSQPRENTLSFITNEVIAAILGAFAGAWLTYLGAVKMADRQFIHLRDISKIDAWRISARDFINAFASDLAAIESGANLKAELPEFLRLAYEARHSNAVATFEYMISSAKREDFKTKWKHHCYGPDSSGAPMSPEDVGIEHDKLLFLHYSEHYDTSGPGASRKLASQRIRSLLAFAQET